MSYEDWFNELDIQDDIDEVFCLYRTIKERSSNWGYDVKDSGNIFVVSNCYGEAHRFTSKTQLTFCNYLDSLYELGVEGEHELQKNMRKSSDKD
jgi:hypothetical protein